MKISGCDNRVKKPMVLVGVLRLSPSPHENILQVHRVDQTLLPAQVHSFVGCSFHCALHPLQEGEMKEKGEVLHLYRCYTHTHPAGAGSTLKGKRKKKADTTTGRRPKQRRGGREQTDLQNQPARRDGPNQHRAHTPKPHDTLQRGTGEELGTEWGLVDVPTN